MRRAALLSLALLSCGRDIEVQDADFSVSDVCINQAVGKFPQAAIRRGVAQGYIDTDIRNFRILADGSTGACSVPFAGRWASAIECALDKVDSCLVDLNSEKAKAVREATSTLSGRKPLHIACNISPAECPGALALTTVPDSPDFARRVTQWQMLNEKLLQGYSDEDLCAVALHELLHFAGYSGALPDPVTKKGGHADEPPPDDDIYSCARYCAACRPGPTTTGMQDCLACAGNDFEKAACGTSFEVKAMTSNFPPPDQWCHVPGGYAPCRLAWGVRGVNCDGSLPYGEQLRPDCCETCSAGTMSSDVYCHAWHVPIGVYPCDVPPPECRATTIPGPGSN